MVKEGARGYVGEDEQQFCEQRRDNQRLGDPVGHTQYDAMTGQTVFSSRLRMDCRWGHLEEQRRGALSVMAGLVPALHAIKRRPAFRYFNEALHQRRSQSQQA